VSQSVLEKLNLRRSTDHALDDRTDTDGNPRALLIALLDPDRLGLDDAAQRIELLESNGVDAFFLGGSLSQYLEFDEYARRVKYHASVPVIGFPGSINQISAHLDAILYLSVISGRNPETLFGQHVQVAPLLHRLRLEVIPTGYMLVESGKLTTAQYVSHSLPLPRDKPSVAAATALAGEYLGLRLLYLDAGSGAEHSVPVEIVEAVRESTSIPILVGGGIREPDVAAAHVRAGASAIVIGTVFEENPDEGRIRAFAEAVHG
jgi:phosphoglycerol geranylgeranyltransferase